LEGVAVHKSVVVGKAGDRDLLGDLYLPTAAAGLRPAIVVVHGGGWRKGRPESVRGFGELLGRAGFVCLLADYRLTTEACWPAQIEDVKCAIRFLRASSESLEVDPERIGPRMPEIVRDLPGGAKRFRQTANGIAATVVNGEVLLRDNVHTGAQSGRLLRGPLARA